MAIFADKLVSVLNENVETGKIMNALAHMCVGFGANLGTESLQLIEYKDSDDNSHPYISKMPFIILKANSNKIKKLRQEAIANQISFVDFTDTMTIGTWEEQLELTNKKTDEELTYFGIVLFGNWDTVSAMTKKFSLWK